ncbi:MAG: hypothetical protein LBL69_03200, partial [Zoogloeaceae bacterium]|nr:hypothetical protein [Zoogloeaceae bacterium]
MMVQGIGSTVVLRHLFLFFVLLLAGMAAQAQEVRLVGVMGTRALIAIDGGAPKPLRAGETVDGVKVLSVSAQGIRLEIAGQQQG